MERSQGIPHPCQAASITLKCSRRANREGRKVQSAQKVPQQSRWWNVEYLMGFCGGHSLTSSLMTRQNA